MLLSYRRAFLFLHVFLFASLIFLPYSLHAQTPLVDDVTVNRLGTIKSGAVRLVLGDDLYYSTLSGDIYVLNISGGGIEQTLLYTRDDHGLREPWGMTIGPDDTIYLVGNEDDGPNTEAIIMKGVRDNPAERNDLSRTWSVFARTESHPLSNSPFNHHFNGMVVSPDGQYLFVNSGSRTDHGEIQDNAGNFPGAREVAITAVILRLPIDSENLLLPNDSTALAPYVYARGVRNHFELEFAPNGDLFAIENAGDRDDPEELNWIREGHHYGFPWRMGANDTGQQFADYDPDKDALINPDTYAAKNGLFYNDPTYPARPENVEFTDPIPNLGPDADRFIDPATGAVRDASDDGVAIHSFTGHRSPIGLTFQDSTIQYKDFIGILDPYRGGGFVLGWTTPDTDLLSTIEPGGGGDLLHLNLDKNNDSYTMHTTRIVEGFDHPIDMVFYRDDYRMLVIENGAARGIFEVLFPFGGPTSVGEELPQPGIRLSVYPNPSHERATVRYELDREGPVRIEVFDVLGRLITTLVDERQAAGTYERSLQMDGLSTGLYLVRMTSADRRVYQTMAQRE